MIFGFNAIKCENKIIIYYVLRYYLIRRTAILSFGRNEMLLKIFIIW